MKKYLILTILAFSISACTSKKVVEIPPENPKVVATNDAFFQKVLKAPNYEAIKINSKLNVENGSFIPTLSATIYLEKNNKVWLNLSALFINVARGIADKDGIKAYESYNKTYIDSNFEYLNRLLNVNFIDLNSLQNLLLGRTFIPVNENDFDLVKNADSYSLSSQKNQIIKSGNTQNEYKIELKYDLNLQLNRIYLQEVKTGEALEVFYTNWQNVSGIFFPQNVKIMINGKKKTVIEIENTKFDFSKMATPFSIPNNYTKTVIK